MALFSSLEAKLYSDKVPHCRGQSYLSLFKADVHLKISLDSSCYFNVIGPKFIAKSTAVARLKGPDCQIFVECHTTESPVLEKLSFVEV